MSEQPAGHKRKQRMTFNCAECRRMKLKCDRQVPCCHCVKRECADLCPNEARKPVKETESAAQVEALTTRILALEKQLRRQSTGLGSTDAHREMTGNSTDQASPPIRGQVLQAPSSAESTSQMQHEASAQEPLESIFPASTTEAPGKPYDSLLHRNPLPVDDSPIHAAQLAAMSSALIAYGAESAHGTLALGLGGRSKYLGHTAASEWLKDQEQFADSQVVSRLPSPEAQFEPPNTFPFEIVSGTQSILAQLPARGEAERIIECYFRYFAWQHDAISRGSLQVMTNSIYAQLLFPKPQVDHHELAVLFIVLAMGSLHDLESPINDPSVKLYMELSRRCLARGDFMRRHTVAAVQALHIMAHVQLESEEGRNGDSAWTLWGLVMRLNVAMGLHRDGERWGLPDDVVQDRRHIFWECHSTDIMQANCFSRPASLSPHHTDTLIPTKLKNSPDIDIGSSFHILKLQLAQITSSCLDMSLNLNQDSTDWVPELQNRLEAFERSVPFRMRCRTAYFCLSSLCSEPQSVPQITPEPSKRDLALLFQQYTLAINICETMLFLNRPFYARAIQELEKDPSQSTFGRSFLVVVERCNAITELVRRLHEMLPAVTVRMWWLWYHAFNAAVCLATLVLRSPRNPLAEYAVVQVDTTIRLLRQAVNLGISRRVKLNLDWLEKLRVRISERLNQSSGPEGLSETSPEVTVVDEGLLGWRTRLVHRAATTNSTPILTRSIANPAITGGVQSAPDTASTVNHAGVMDDLLHQFWDPMMFQAASSTLDISNPANWWDGSGQGL